jgi:hypothetical protein
MGQGHAVAAQGDNAFCGLLSQPTEIGPVRLRLPLLADTATFAVRALVGMAGKSRFPQAFAMTRKELRAASRVPAYRV